MEAQVDSEIYAAHARGLTVFARSLVGPNDAADVVSDAVLAALGSPGWRSVTNHRAYLYRAVWNRSQTLLSRRSARPRIERSAARREKTMDVTSAAALAGDSDVIAAVENLSPQQRAVIALTYWRDLPVAEVAEILDISDGAVRKQLARARARLREVLDERQR